MPGEYFSSLQEENANKRDGPEYGPTKYCASNGILASTSLVENLCIYPVDTKMRGAQFVDNRRRAYKSPLSAAFSETG
jgi:hypothetical protein